MPDFPSRKARAYAGNPIALGATMPIPVMTTRLNESPLRSSPLNPRSETFLANSRSIRELHRYGAFANEIDGISDTLKSFHLVVANGDFETVFGFENDVDESRAVHLKIGDQQA